MSRTPNIETVWIDDLLWTPTLRDGDHCWQNLQSLFIGENASMMPNAWSPLDMPVPLFRTAIIREVYLELLSAMAGIYLSLLLRQSPVFDGVRSISIKTRSPICKSYLETLLRSSFTSETIEELSIAPFPFVNVDLESEEMDWFKSSSLTCLSLTGLTLEAGRSIGSADDALISMVNRFPNLCCLEIDKEIIQPSTLAKIVSTTRVRTIYHLSGYLMEDVRAWAAKKYGAQIINGFRPSPAQHPDRPLVSARLAQSLRRPRDT